MTYISKKTEHVSSRTMVQKLYKCIMRCFFMFSIGIYLLLSSGCSWVVGQPDVQNDVTTITSGGADLIYPCTRADLNTDSDNMIEVNLSAIDTDYIITDAGDYLLSGSYNRQLIIDAEEQIVHLIFNGVNIYSLSGAAINIKSAGKVVITLAEGTSNTIRDSAHYRGKVEGDATIYSNCDLTINGTGALNVYGFYNDAIHSKDVVKILGGEIFIQAKGNGIQGNDGLLVKTVSLNIESTKNGLCSTRIGNDNKGTLDIAGGNISIISGRYAISSAKDLYIRNCSIWSNSVIGNLNISGDEYIMEGCLENG